MIGKADPKPTPQRHCRRPETAKAQDCRSQPDPLARRRVFANSVPAKQNWLICPPQKRQRPRPTPSAREPDRAESCYKGRWCFKNARTFQCTVGAIPVPRVSDPATATDALTRKTARTLSRRSRCRSARPKGRAAAAPLHPFYYIYLNPVRSPNALNDRQSTRSHPRRNRGSSACAQPSTS